MVRPLIVFAFVVAGLCLSNEVAAQDVPRQSPQSPSDVIPTPVRSAHKLEDFSRLSRAIGERILLIDPSGVVREGVLAGATADGVMMRFGSVTQTFPRAEVASAERLKDSPADGVLKGMLFAALCGWGDTGASAYLAGIAVFGGIGYLIDAGESHREPLYRAAGFSLHTASLPSARTVAFRIRF
jgi:hypothetical protein